MNATRGHRQQRIADLIRRQAITSQHELRKLLRQDGIRVTQATLSRDLREIGAVKSPRGYRFAEQPPPTPEDLARSVRTYLLSLTRGEGLVVVRTRPGHSHPLALEIDRAQHKSVLGTIAGDDTIFIATRSSREAEALEGELRSMAGIV